MLVYDESSVTQSPPIESWNEDEIIRNLKILRHFPNALILFLVEFRAIIILEEYSVSTLVYQEGFQQAILAILSTLQLRGENLSDLVQELIVLLNTIFSRARIVDVNLGLASRNVVVNFSRSLFEHTLFWLHDDRLLNNLLQLWDQLLEDCQDLITNVWLNTTLVIRIKRLDQSPSAKVAFFNLLAKAKAITAQEQVPMTPNILFTCFSEILDLLFANVKNNGELVNNGLKIVSHVTHHIFPRKEDILQIFEISERVHTKEDITQMLQTLGNLVSHEEDLIKPYVSQILRYLYVCLTSENADYFKVNVAFVLSNLLSEGKVIVRQVLESNDAFFFNFLRESLTSPSIALITECIIGFENGLETINCESAKMVAMTVESLCCHGNETIAKKAKSFMEYFESL